jgi:hypothetical protein
MNLLEITQIGGAILISCGGAGAIMMGLSSWLGKVWAKRILESDRNKYSLAMESIRQANKTYDNKQRLYLT